MQLLMEETDGPKLEKSLALWHEVQTRRAGGEVGAGAGAWGGDLRIRYELAQETVQRLKASVAELEEENLGLRRRREANGEGEEGKGAGRID